MTTQEFIAYCSERTGVPKSRLKTALAAMTDSIAAAIREGEPVKLYGFGMFTTYRRPPGKGRDYRTGEQVDVPPKIKLQFKPGGLLLDAVNEGKDIWEEKWQSEHKDM